MNKNEIELILKEVLESETEKFFPPSETDWNELEKYFSCTFPDEFKDFVGLLSEWCFPGDILNISEKGNNNGNDGIRFVYEWEIQYGNWEKSMIPFYGIGNGDYFCLCSKDQPVSKVYYYYHDKGSWEVYVESFVEWIKQLRDFLS